MTAYAMIRALLMSVVVAHLAGCVPPKGSDSSNPAVSVQTARVLDINQRRLIPVNAFSSNERMAAVIKNLTSHDQVLHVEFMLQGNVIPVWRNALSIPKGQTHSTGPLKPLPAGSYAVKVSGTGIKPVFTGFTVYGY